MASPMPMDPAMNPDTLPKEINLKVFVRVRPAINDKENTLEPQIFVESDNKHITVKAPVPDPQNIGDQRFKYDHVFDTEDTQDVVFDRLRCSELINRLWAGYSTTIFAYGMTGSGKTYTIVSQEGKLHKSTRTGWGLETNANIKHHINIEFIEVYNETIRDLLRKPGTKPTELKIMHDEVQGTTSPRVTTFEEVMELIRVGMINRQTDSTAANEVSSRSHSIFTLTVSTIYTVMVRDEAVENVVTGRIQLVDLAGAENLKRFNPNNPIAAGLASPFSPTSSDDERSARRYMNEFETKQKETRNMREMAKINQSLSCLVHIIDQLSDEYKLNEIKKGRLKLGYRDSKLTHLLKSSLDPTAPTHTYMIANINPFERMLSTQTLRYAQSAKNMKTTVVANTTTSLDKRKEIDEEVAKLEFLIGWLYDNEVLVDSPEGISPDDAVSSAKTKIGDLDSEKSNLSAELELVALSMAQRDIYYKLLCDHLHKYDILYTLGASLADIEAKKLRSLCDGVIALSKLKDEGMMMVCVGLPLERDLVAACRYGVSRIRPLCSERGHDPWLKLMHVQQGLHELNKSFQLSNTVAQDQQVVLEKIKAMLQEQQVVVFSSIANQSQPSPSSRMGAKPYIQRLADSLDETIDIIGKDFDRLKAVSSTESLLASYDLSVEVLIREVCPPIKDTVERCAATTIGRGIDSRLYISALDLFKPAPGVLPNAMIDVLHPIVTAYDEAVRELELRTSSLQEKVQVLEKHNTEITTLLHAKKGELLEQIESKSQKISQLSTELEQLKQQHADLSADHSTAVAKNAQVAKDLEDESLKLGLVRGVLVSKHCRKKKEKRILYLSPDYSRLCWKHVGTKVDVESEAKRCLMIDSITEAPGANNSLGQSTAVHTVIITSSKRTLVVDVDREADALTIARCIERLIKH